MTQPGIPVTNIRSIEHGPSVGGEAGSEADEFASFLQQRETIATGMGGMTATDFVVETIEYGLECNVISSPQHMRLIVQSGFGSKDRVLSLLEGLSIEEAEMKFGDLLPLLVDYILSEEPEEATE